MKLKELPKHLRPREKIIKKGPENVKTGELLAVLLRTGKEGKNVLQLAQDILSKYPIETLAATPVETLITIDGIDRGKATAIIAAFELSRRADIARNSVQTIISKPIDALPFLTTISTRKKEYFVALYLNARNAVVHQEIISVGTLTSSIVHPREVFEPAIRASAAAMIIAHNHPSGDTSPSDQDIRITNKLVDAAAILDIDIVDHLIVSEKGYTSLKEEGYM